MMAYNSHSVEDVRRKQQGTKMRLIRPEREVRLLLTDLGPKFKVFKIFEISKKQFVIIRKPNSRENTVKKKKPSPPLTKQNFPLLQKNFVQLFATSNPDFIFFPQPLSHRLYGKFFMPMKSSKQTFPEDFEAHIPALKAFASFFFFLHRKTH